MRLPYGRSQGSVVAVGYSPCLTMRPRSSTSVFRPFSVSSLAAQPPLIPVPTTIASNEFVSKRAPLVQSRRHYGLLARTTGSVQTDVPDHDRHRGAADGVFFGGRRLRLTRPDDPERLDLQILLRAHPSPGRRSR